MGREANAAEPRQRARHPAGGKQAQRGGQRGAGSADNPSGAWGARVAVGAFGGLAPEKWTRDGLQGRAAVAACLSRRP